MLDSFGTRGPLEMGDRTHTIFRLAHLSRHFAGVERLPRSLKILLENLLRNEDGEVVTGHAIETLARWQPGDRGANEIAFRPARVLLQDFTGVPAVVDLAAMREAVREMGGDPQRINPVQPVDLVIDHSVQVDRFGTADSFAANVELEFQRNRERYTFLRWGQQAFENFRVVPPGTGICHQVNLEHLAQVVFEDVSGAWFPDTLVGTDSHTPMINGLGVLGWGVGGIEAEAAMLGQPLSMLIPEVVGIRLRGRLPVGATATDLVLTVAELLRQRGVVGKFVEFCGPGLADLPLADRATIANMTPEFGATCSYFPVDDQTLAYLRFSNRADDLVQRVERYCREQGLFQESGGEEPLFSELLELDLTSIEASVAGPRRPHDRVPVPRLKQVVEAELAAPTDGNRAVVEVSHGDVRFDLADGAVVIAAITSCTNTSNPSVMIAAGLLARAAVERGLRVPPWVKTSLAPGSRVVTDYLLQAGLTPYLEALGFHTVGYGCTTCIGNSGSLLAPVARAVEGGDLSVAAVLSGNRNFEGRINPLTRLNFLASPPLVVAYALAGTVRIDLSCEPLGLDRNGEPVHLQDLWPDGQLVAETVARSVHQAQFARRYSEVFSGDERWRDLEAPAGRFYRWDPTSTYVRLPPFFAGVTRQPAPVADVVGARVLALLGDSVTTDHISPAGAIAGDGEAARFLEGQGVTASQFNSYGARRGNHEVMMRGTFGNIRLRNQLATGHEGSYTRHLPSGDRTSIFEAAARYRTEQTPLIVVAGAEYGTGSSRDWAAKGTLLLGVRAVIAKSFERIHRSNLVGMGVLPLQFMPGEDATTLGLCGEEEISLRGLDGLEAGQQLPVEAVRSDGSLVRFEVTVRIDTPNEAAYYRHGGILLYVLRQLLAQDEPADSQALL